MDIIVQAEEADITILNLAKGTMHLVETDRQHQILARFADRPKTEELGGSGLNAIRTLARLGARTAFAGMTGTDSFGEKILVKLGELGITSKIQKSSYSTGTCAILVTPDGERTMNTHLGASRLFDENLVPYDEIAQAKIFHFCGYQWDTEGQKAAINAAIKWAKAHGTLVSFDAADPFVVERNTAVFRDMIEKYADIVFANEQEARLLYGSTPEAAAEAITQGGAIAVIKLGAKGALVAKGQERIRIEAVPTTVVDTTAAGDMFASGFLYGLHLGKSLAQSGHIAAILASDVISRFGAQVSEAALARVRSI
jgi:sugar/nucleoside kinase (ribokinase family)